MFTFKVFLSLSRLPWNPHKTWTILSHPGLWGSPLLKPPPLPLPPAASFNTTVGLRTELFHFPFYSHLFIPNTTLILLYTNTPKNTHDRVFIFFFHCVPLRLLTLNPKAFFTASLPVIRVSFALWNRGSCWSGACCLHSPSSLSSFQVRSKANKAKGQAKGAWEV